MVAQMYEHSMTIDVEWSPCPNRSRGLVNCRLQKTNMYDHRRHHADRIRGEMLFECDFVLTRDDGTQVSIRPNYSNTQIECYMRVPGQDHEVPATGLGGSSGPGTFKHYTNKNIFRSLRFKVPYVQSAKATATRATCEANAKAKAAVLGRLAHWLPGIVRA
jgi:hypothetical protein